MKQLDPPFYFDPVGVFENQRISLEIFTMYILIN